MAQLIECMSDRIESLCERVRNTRQIQVKEIQKNIEMQWATAQDLIKRTPTPSSLVYTDVHAIERATETMRKRLVDSLAAQDTVANVAHGASSNDVDQYLTDVRRSANIVAAALQQTEVYRAVLE
ncbi:hypothetical protein GNI_143680 [Gregarina niphandrodes]|uniref:Uncharacterized protein n=1 Tax=Gregarina niphandrodes TaxID=110365 RepID=A0A023B012_GRENI|nr:hypothetical protein GNI_143680 [Gregarina niphandrodes]EZG44783.1 hypothetical protein GNI_143680 [Gregarina niphandrodes]|eukprot:XP_011132665.1 hypothetical protein GNI_143680 [Gregarina niphandrodes]